MKFLVDVNASGAVAAWLAAQGHDVARVTDRDPRMSDGAVLAWAMDESRIIVTTDQDFEEMIWREGRPHAGLLRLPNVRRAEREALLQSVLEQYGESLQTGAIVIATSSKVRIRRR